MLDERGELARKFAKLSAGNPYHVVMEASAIMMINALRQSHRNLDGALLELEDIVARMKAALRERHYEPSGERKVTNIVIPPLRELFPEVRQ